MAKTLNNPLALAGGLFDQIRLAGLGAVAKAQEEGTRLLTTLIEEGESIEARFKDKSMKLRKPQTTAQDRAQLEQIFEDRVSRILKQKKIPTQQDLKALSSQLETLQQRIDRLTKQRRQQP